MVSCSIIRCTASACFRLVNLGAGGTIVPFQRGRNITAGICSRLHNQLGFHFLHRVGVLALILYALIVFRDISTYITGEGAAGDRNILHITILTLHFSDDCVACKLSAGNIKDTPIHGIIDITVQNDRAGSVASIKGPAGNLGYVPVQYASLRKAGKATPIYFQLAVVVVLQRIQTAAEITAVNRHNRRYLV